MTEGQPISFRGPYMTSAKFSDCWPPSPLVYVTFTQPPLPLSAFPWTLQCVNESGSFRWNFRSENGLGHLDPILYFSGTAGSASDSRRCYPQQLHAILRDRRPSVVRQLICRTEVSQTKRLPSILIPPPLAAFLQRFPDTSPYHTLQVRLSTVPTCPKLRVRLVYLCSGLCNRSLFIPTSHFQNERLLWKNALFMVQDWLGLVRIDLITYKMSVFLSDSSEKMICTEVCLCYDSQE